MTNFPKFRAWVKSETGGEDYMSFPRWIDLEGKRICTESGLQPSEFELMGFTGLKDKNDKDIYEDDIVSHVYKSNGIIKEKIYIVCFDLGCFYCLDKNKRMGSSVGYYTTLVRGNGLEVVGNIHANLELLGREKEENKCSQ